MDSLRHPTSDQLLRHAPEIRRLVRHMVHDESTVDDVVQSTWVKALERPPRHTRQLGAWLKAIARNVALNTLRANRRRESRETKSGQHRVEDDFPEVAAALEGHRLLLDAIARLPTRQRATVVRHYFHGRKPREIATEEGVTVQAVNARLRRAREALRSDLEGSASGGRDGWLALLAPCSEHLPPARGASLLSGGSPVVGATLMGWKTAIIGTAIALVCFTSGWTLRPILDPEEPPPAQASRVASEVRQGPTLSGAPADTLPPDSVNREDPDRTDQARGAVTLLDRLQGAQWPKASAAIAREIALLPGSQAIESLRAIYAQVSDPRKRAQLVRAFRGAPLHADFLRAAALAIDDKSARNQHAAMQMIEHLAMTRFDGDAAKYEAWLRVNEGRDVAAVIEDGARAFTTSLLTLDDATLLRRLAQVHPNVLLDAQAKDPIDRRAILREEGILELLMRAIQSNERSGALRRNAMTWLTSVQPPTSFIDEHFRAILSDPGAYEPAVAISAYDIVARSELHDALDLLLEALVITPRRSDWMALASAIGRRNQARAIPHLIGMIGAVHTDTDRKTIAWSGLRPLTGVAFDPDHDAAWWSTWWTDNKHRFDALAQRTPIPTLSPRGR